MPLGFFLHRRARATADRLLARLCAPCPVLIEVGPPRWPAPSAGATMGALNAYLGAVDRLGELAAGRIAIAGQWLERERAAARYGVVAELHAGASGIEAFGGRLAEAAAELGQQLRFGYGLGIALPVDDAAPAERIAIFAELLERAAADGAEGRRLAVMTRRVEPGRSGRWRRVAASDWLLGPPGRSGRRDRGGRGRLYVTLVDTGSVAAVRERRAAAGPRAPDRLAGGMPDDIEAPCSAQSPAEGVAGLFGALPPASLPVRPSPSIRCRTASR